MKNKFLRALIECSLILFIFCSGCSLKPETKKTAIPSPSSMNTNPSSLTYSVESGIKTTIGTPTILHTKTIVPTLERKEAFEEIEKLLSTNNNCSLPCFWGIMPGTSSEENISMILQPLSGISSLAIFSSDHGTITPKYTNNDLIILLDIYYHLRRTTVDVISFTAMPYVSNQQSFTSERYGKLINYYLISNILNDLGKPSRILLSTKGGIYPDNYIGTVFFDLLLEYESSGLMLNYRTEMHIINNRATGCFAFPQLEIDSIFLDGSISFQEAISPSWDYRLVDYKPLEEATELSIDQFVYQFTAEQNYCISSPLSLWPTLSARS